MPLLTALFFIFMLPFTLNNNPELMALSAKNECIREIVTVFVTGDTCETLTQQRKSQLALRMTNCLFVQMGKKQIKCNSADKCVLEGDAWNTFTTFFAHIDNLCHFYWDISKAKRTEQMIDALLVSAQTTEATLSKNNENTKQILELQSALKLQILSSMATQQQMSEIISNSSLALSNLASHLSSSLNKIHQDIDQHYAIITRILSAVNQVLSNLDSLQMYLVAQATSLQGFMFFISLIILVFVGCLVSKKVRRRRNECLILISLHFLTQFFFSRSIHAVIGVQSMRCLSLLMILILILCAREPKDKFEQTLEIHLNSQRMGKIMERAIRKQLPPIEREPRISFKQKQIKVPKTQ